MSNIIILRKNKSRVIMALFKTDEERKIEEEEKLKEAERKILKWGEFHGKVGHIHQGLSYAGVWGVRNNGKIKFKPTIIKIHDTKLLIQRNKMIVEFSNIKEIFQEYDYEVILILNNDDGIPLQARNSGASGRRELKAFLNILNKLIEENKTNTNTTESNINNTVNSEDKFEKLIKLGEMYDKGLLTDEEFASLKQELLSGNNQDATNTLEEVEPLENTCVNCSAEISPDDAFCSECGTKINKN